MQTIPRRKLALFVVLSGLDLVLTWLLLRSGDGSVYEGNPVANWWLARGGWVGLAGFKFAVVAFVGGLCVVISAYRPRTGRLVLSFACSVLLVVVLYSSAVAGYVGVQGECPCCAIVRKLEDDGWLLDRRLKGDKEYRAIRRQLSAEVIGRRLPLREAVTRLRASEMGRDPRWVKVLRLNYPGLSDEGCLAANLVEFTLTSWKSRPEVAAAVSQLEGEFQAAYGSLPPRRWQESLVWKDVE